MAYGLVQGRSPRSRSRAGVQTVPGSLPFNLFCFLGSLSVPARLVVLATRAGFSFFSATARTRSGLTFFAEDAATRALLYANADVSKATQNREVIKFITLRARHPASPHSYLPCPPAPGPP